MSANEKIKSIAAREVLDSRGNPTLECEVGLAGGARGIAIVPSGASTGSKEALELRDGDAARYRGRGVLNAAANVNAELREKLTGAAFAQDALDECMCALDGDENKKRLGANAILGVSLAHARAVANARGRELFAHFGELFGNQNFLLPLPQMNIINGGAHADNAIDFQEFMILPAGFDSFGEALRAGVEIFHALGDVLRAKKMATGVGDEGGFAPECKSNEEALQLIMRAIENANYRAGEDVFIGLDAASSEFYRDGKYHLRAENLSLDADGFAEYLERWTKKYPIVSIEDGMDENDWEGWARLTRRLGARVQLTGDDLFVTNSKVLQRGIDMRAANSILIKFNQIGTLSETFAAIKLAQRANFCATISHRSGESEDTTIADLAVATGAGQIKTGSLCRSERVAKYNRLLKIEQLLGGDARYAGRDACAALARDSSATAI